MVSDSNSQIQSLRLLYEHQMERKGNRDFTAVVHTFVEVLPDGHIVRKDGSSQHHVWFGRVRSDDDLRAALRINASLFGTSQKYTEDQLVAFRRAWLMKNPDVYRILEIDGEVVGFIFAMPLSKPIIDRALAGEIKVGDIALDSLQQYQSDHPVDIYLQTLGLHKRLQGGEKTMAGFYLIAGMEHLFAEIGALGVEVRSIYTRSDEPDGVKLCAALGFEEITIPTPVTKLVMQLDFSKEKPGLRPYKEAFASYMSHQRRL